MEPCIDGKTPSSPLKVRGRPKKVAEATKETSTAGDHRHRKTEQEEDEELLKEIRKSEAVFRFEKSPWCKQLPGCDCTWYQL